MSTSASSSSGSGSYSGSGSDSDSGSSSNDSTPRANLRNNLTMSAPVTPAKVPSPLVSQTNPALTTPLLDQVRTKWERPLDQLPVHTDFLRMFPGMTLEEDGELLWTKYRDRDTSDRASKEICMRDFFCLLAQRDEEDPLLATWVQRKFLEYIPDGASNEGAQTPIHFRRLLRDVIPEESSVTSVLKCLNQAIAAPAVMILKLTTMFNKMMYKDCRGIWDCHINYADDKVVITHLKWEESMPKAYEFAWALDIELSRDGREVTNCTLRIDTIRWTAPAPEATKLLFRNTLKAFINEKTREESLPSAQ